MRHRFDTPHGRVCLLLGSAIALAGCGPDDGLERAPISGVLTVQGMPLPHALVQFIPQAGTPGHGAIGISDEQGNFEVISSRDQDEGVPAGEYVVRVSRLVNPDGSFVPPTAAEADFPECREAVPPPYSGVASPIRVVITSEGGNVSVDVPEELLVKGGT